MPENLSVRDSLSGPPACLAAPRQSCLEEERPDHFVDHHPTEQARARRLTPAREAVFQQDGQPDRDA
jgi:hypothetical protein